MSFFLPNRTTCAICGKPIAARAEATRLPYTDPARVPVELARLGRSFVHRRCWATWPHAASWSEGARALRLADPAPARPLLHECDGLFVWPSGPHSVQLEDVVLPLEVDVPFTDMPVARAVLAGSEPGRVGAYDWRFADGQLGLDQDGEAIERAPFTAERRALWQAMLARLG